MREGVATFPGRHRRDRRATGAHEKEPFRRRLTRPIREAAALADTLFRRPRDFPAETLSLIRRGFRRVWAARGGGLYACGFFVTFVLLEVRMLFDDISGAAGVGDFVVGQTVEWVFRFTVESIQNTVHAFLWPLHVIGFQPPWGIIGLGVAWLLFPAILKEPLEAWLFGSDRDTGTVHEDTDK